MLGADLAQTQTKAGLAMSDPDAPTPRVIFARCERFLYGQGASTPREQLRALADELGEAELWDWYGEGALIEDLEREVAGILGLEAAVFMPSGTMAQQIALRIWSDQLGCPNIAYHPTCHLELHTNNGMEALHGLKPVLVGGRERLLTLADLEAIAEPLGALLIELPQREIGGMLPSWEALESQSAWARDRGVPLHMDGARLWECQPFYDRPYREIAALFDSVYVSFYKGLAGLAGAALCGTAAFVKEARCWLKRHGGLLIHTGPYLVSARVGLREELPRFAEYRDKAREVAEVFASFPGVIVKPDPPHCHMMHVYLPASPERAMAASFAIAERHKVALFRKVGPCEVPGMGKFELSIGAAASRISAGELRDLFAEALEIMSAPEA